MDISVLLKKQVPQYSHFRRGITNLTYSLKKLGETLKLQKQILQT